MQKTQWRSRTSSCKFRWLDYSRSQVPKRQLRISKQSSIRSRPREESFLIPLKYIDVARNTHTSLDVLLEKILMITGTWMEKKRCVRWIGFTRFFLLNERSPDGYTWSRGRLARKPTTSRPHNAWPNMWKHMSDASKRKGKQKWVIEKPKLDNARQLRGIFFIEADDEEFKHSMKNACHQRCLVKHQ